MTSEDEEVAQARLESRQSLDQGVDARIVFDHVPRRKNEVRYVSHLVGKIAEPRDQLAIAGLKVGIGQVQDRKGGHGRGHSEVVGNEAVAVGLEHAVDAQDASGRR